jgi:hypothetical protein
MRFCFVTFMSKDRFPSLLFLAARCLIGCLDKEHVSDRFMGRRRGMTVVVVVVSIR